MSAVARPGGEINATFADRDDTLVTKARWNELAAIRAIIGTCHYLGCGGNLQAVEASVHDAQGETGRVTWYEAKCNRCGREVAAPNGRVMRGSAAHGETPRGWLESRAQRDAETRRFAAGHHP